MSVRRLIRPLIVLVCLVLVAAGCAPGTVGNGGAADPADRWPCG